MRIKIRKRSEEYVIDEVDGKDMETLYTEAWRAVDPEVRQRAIAIIQEKVFPEELQNVRDNYEKYGNAWYEHEPFSTVSTMPTKDGPVELPIPWHWTGGMALRNLLRLEGIKDDELPPFDAYYGEGTDVRNWDDYYKQAIEAAAGVRED